MDDILLLRKYAVKNALEYGKANPKAVIGKVLAEHPELKSKAKELFEKAVSVCEEINKLSKEKLEEEFKSYRYNLPKKEEKRFRLENVGEKVVLRFAPEPSGYLHIGHAKAIFINQALVSEYNGIMHLRFDDTNPKKESQEYVDAIIEDLEWLEVKWNRTFFASDFIPRLYNVARRFLEQGIFYVALEPAEKIRKMRETGKPLESRKNRVEKNLELFDKMLEGAFSEGEAAVLLKGELNSTNTALRDPTMMRIIEHPHFRMGSKYRVWPTYDFSSPFLDSWIGVTHALRSKEYELRTPLYKILLSKAHEREVEVIHFSRLEIKGTAVSKRIIKPLVEKGLVWGWDDPRLPTLRGLRRRGILPEAIKRFVLRFGMGKQEKIVDWEFLLKENRSLLDKKVKRLFFVRNPVKVKIEFEGLAEVPYHPEIDMGIRRQKVKGTVYLEKEDLKNQVLRLKGIGDFELAGNTLIPSEKKGRVVHWVAEGKPAILYVPQELLKEDGTYNENSLITIEGLVEIAVNEISEGEIVQFERVGFAKLDDKKHLKFIYSC